MERTISNTLALDLGKLISLEEGIYRVLVFFLTVICMTLWNSAILSRDKMIWETIGEYLLWRDR